MGLHLSSYFFKNLLSNRRRCFYKLGDCVQLKSGGNLMRVVEVIDKASFSEPQVWCKWYESATKEIRINVFHESDLQPFDWE